MILLIGGGDLLAKYARYVENKRDLKIISSRRMLDSILLNKRLLREELNEIGVRCIEATSLDEYEVGKLMEESNITISFASPWIFRQEHIDKCKEIVNVHLTELPEWKGAASISWKLLCNAKKGGSTIHRLTNKIDKGEILFQDKYEIPEDLKKPIEWYRHTIAEAENQFLKH